MGFFTNPYRHKSIYAIGGTKTYQEVFSSGKSLGYFATHTFLGGYFDAFQVISGAGDVQVLLVGGGGGGGMDMGGGGGGGGVIVRTLYVKQGEYYSADVGYGGWGAPAGGTNGQPSGHQYTISAQNGNATFFGNLMVDGGGYGGSSYFGYTPNYGYGGSGASGGGSSGYSDGNTGRGGSGYAGQGYSGGGSSGQYYSGGGGGAGGSGAGSGAQPNGGPGVQHPFFSSYYWGGGGGGSAYSLSTGGNGGIGGGGGGAIGTTTGGAGINNGSAGGGGSPNSWAQRPGGDAGANTGGGGGGGSHYNSNNKGGNGGSGIIIVRYPVDKPLITTGGLQLHYDLTNIRSYPGSGTTIYDLSPNGINASGSSSLTSQTLTSEKPYTTGSTSILNTDNHTICFSFRIGAPTGTWDKIFGYTPSGTDRSPGVWRYPSNKLIHWRYDPGNTGVDFGADTTMSEFTTGQWYYCCVTKQGSSAAAYVNGVRVSATTVANPKTSGNSTIQLFPGYTTSNSGMRHLQIYNRALTPEEVVANYLNVKGSLQ